MALSDVLSIVQNKIKETFHVQPFDAKAYRKKLVDKLDKAETQIGNGASKAPNRIWWAGNGGIAFMLSLNDHVVEVGGETWNTVPTDSVPKFIAALKDAIEQGELDDEIERAVEGDSPRIEDAKGSVASVNKLGIPRKSSTGTRGGRTPIANVRGSISRSMSNGKSLEEAEAIARKKGKYDEALIDEVVAEFRATK